MLTKLTKEQKGLKEAIKKEYIDRLNVYSPIEEKSLLTGIKYLYEDLLKRPMPKVIISNDPLKAVARVKKFCKTLLSIHDSGIGFDSGWCAFYDFFSRIGTITAPKFLRFLDLIKCGAFSYIFTDKTVIAIEKPLFIKRNEAKQMHCVSGPAIQWGGGFELYYLNGICMSKDQVMTPAEKLDVKTIVNEKNVDVRRELLRKVGIERFISGTGAKVLDKVGNYELLSVSLSKEVPDARYLKMLNPSIGIWHVEGVEGNTVQEALNWRAGDINKNWNPTLLT